jgi:uncharacterized DUF497 family protein
MEFRWNAWNLDHATRHGISVAESELLIRRGRPRHVGDNKYRIRGQSASGRFIQAIYIIDPDGTFFIIQARPLTDREKRNLRRRKP